MWPFKKKRPIVQTTPEELLAILSAARRCPEQQQVSRSCVCMECKKKLTCVVEETCRKVGCESIIRSCSLKSQANGDSSSEFGGIIADIFTRKMLRSMNNEDEYKKMTKDLLERQKAKEVEDAKKKDGSEGALEGDGPPISM